MTKAKAKNSTPTLNPHWEWVAIRSEEDIDAHPHVLTLARAIHDRGFKDKTTVNWRNFLMELDGSFLPNGHRVDLGQFNTPAIKRIKSHILDYRKK